MSQEEDTESTRYWRTNLKLVGCLLVVWFSVSYGAAILFVEPLNTIHLGGFPLGFWFAQQGAILVFIALIFIYCRTMDRVDEAYRGPEHATAASTDVPTPSAEEQGPA